MGIFIWDKTERDMPKEECSSNEAFRLANAGRDGPSQHPRPNPSTQERSQTSIPEEDIHPRESGGQEKKKRRGYQDWSQSPTLSLLALPFLVCPHHANDLLAALLNLSEILLLRTSPLLVCCEPFLTCPVFFLGVVCVGEHARIHGQTLLPAYPGSGDCTVNGAFGKGLDFRGAVTSYALIVELLNFLFLGR
jgi:hypothetical protein